jgi:hypothetical protein
LPVLNGDDAEAQEGRAVSIDVEDDDELERDALDCDTVSLDDDFYLAGD